MSRRARPRFRRRRAALTLVEIVIVVLIIGVLSAIAVPKYAVTMRYVQLEAAAERVAADLRYARQYAKTKGTTQSVVFTPATDTYTLPGMNDVDHPSQAFAVDLTSGEYPASIASASLGSGGAETTVVFDLYGRPDFGGTVVVQLGSEQRTVTIDGTSGRVSVQP